MMIRMVAIAFIALTAAPASAQDIVFSPDATNACLQDASTLSDRHACIGTSANLCMEETEFGMTTAGMSRCLWAENLYWDARLNQTYQTELTRAVETDAEMTAIGATVPSFTETLKAMQRAWIPFRDAACAYHVAGWGNGTGAGPAGAACLMRMTGEQTLLLEAETY